MIAAGAALLLPASAAATDRYVDFGAGGSAPCTDPANPCTTIAEALGPAVDGDVIHLAPGHYVEAVSTEVNVTLIGAAPVLRGESFDSNLHTVIQSAGGPAPSLELKGGGTVRDLTAVGFTGPGSHSPAIVLANPPGGPGASTVRLQGVRAVGGKATEGVAGSPGLDVASPAGDPLAVLVEDSAIETQANSFAASAEGENVELTMRRSLLGSTDHGAPDGLEVSDGVKATVEDGGFAPGSHFDRGYEAGSGSLLRLVRTHVAIDSFAGSGIRASTSVGQSGGVEVIDSLVQVKGLSGISAGGFGETNVSIRGSTIFTINDEEAPAIRASPTSETATIHVDLVNTVVRAVDTDSDDEVDLALKLLAGRDGRRDRQELRLHDGECRSGHLLHPAWQCRQRQRRPALRRSRRRRLPVAAGIAADRPRRPSIVTPGQRDFAGSPRSVDGNLDCVAAPDIGALEFLTGAAALCAGPKPPQPPESGPKPGKPRLLSGAVRVTRRGVAPVRVSCQGQTACVGRLILSARMARSGKKAKGKRQRPRARNKRIGSKRFRIAAGRTVRVRVKLRRGALAKLRRVGRMPVRALATDRAGDRLAPAKRLKLLAPKPKRRSNPRDRAGGA